MKLQENRFKRSIREGTPQIGIWNSLCSEIAAEILAGVGYDWALLDMEHSPNDLRTLLHQLQAYQSGDTVPVVRPPSDEPALVKRILDLGVSNLLFPMVQSAEHAEEIVRMTRYPPRGIRGVSMSQRGNRWGRITDYHQRFEDELCVLMQIETREALERVREIAEVDGVDGIFFGPADLSAALGVMGQLGHDAVSAAIRDGMAAARSTGKPVGTLMGTPEQALGWFKEGMIYVACASDQALLARNALACLTAVRSGLGA
jgi:4-hydroxy-2-oxoheptanedioate aldolase